MKKIAFIIIMFLLNFSPVCIFSNKTIDSLEYALSKTIDKKEKITILTSLAFEFRRKNPEKGLEYAKRAFDLSVKTGNVDGQVYALIIQGVINKNIGDLDKAIENNLDGLKIAEKNDNIKYTSTCYNNLGNIYQIQKKYKKAIDLYKKSLEYELGRKDKEQISIRYYNIGAIYEIIDSLDLALNYYKFSLSYERELKNNEGIFYALYGIAGIETKRKNLDAAEKNIEEALHLAFQTNDAVGKMLCYSEMGNISVKKQDFKKAIEFFEQELVYASEVNYKNEMYEACNSLFVAYKELGNTPLALEYLERSVALRDSVLNQGDNDKIAELEARYESEKKEQKIKEQDIIIEKEGIENDKIYAQRIILLVIIAFMLVLAFFIFRNYRIKNKSNKLLEEKSRQITYSLKYAKKIQTAILPSDDRMHRNFKHSFVLFEPRDIVSGDFYWITCIEQRIIFATADCTGHGVPGAFMSMIGHTLLNEIVGKQRIVEPADILTHLNKGIIHALNQKSGKIESQDDGMDITVCSFDHSFTQLKIALANHHATIIRNNEMTQIDGDLFAIGGIFSAGDTVKFTQQTISLQPGDQLFFYTDGFKDQTGGEKNELYGVKKFNKLLADLSSSEPAQQKELISNEFLRWKGKGKQIDDVLVIGVKI